MKNIFYLPLLTIFLSPCSLKAQDSKEENKNIKVKYKESGRIDFESLLIEGERKRPELSIVTGNVGEEDHGLMIIRKNFKDMIANDLGEVIK